MTLSFFDPAEDYPDSEDEDDRKPPAISQEERQLTNDNNDSQREDEVPAGKKSMTRTKNVKVALISILLAAVIQLVSSENITERGLQQLAVIEGPIITKTIAVGASQLPGGKLLFWSSFNRYYGERGESRTLTEIFDPESGESMEVFVENTNHDMFCPGTAYLSDGRIMVTGGSSARTVSIYDPKSDRWTNGPDMEIPRGYHSMTPLSDGSVFTLGGSWNGGEFEKRGEVWSKEGGWSVKENVYPDQSFNTDDDRGQEHADNHMWLFEAPNGHIFHAGPSTNMHWITTAGEGSVRGAGTRADDEDAMAANPVMYDIGKIFKAGGSRNYFGGLGSDRAYTIDITGDQPVVTRVGNMKEERYWHYNVVLPSGDVVVVGGTRKKIFKDEDAVYSAELWSHQTGEFTRLSAVFEIPRNYHSVGLLLQDGRVMVAGSGLCGEDCSDNHFDAEILTPPYLLNATQRPVITELSTVEFIVGGEIEVVMDTDDDHTFALIRLGSATHSTNNDQRRIPLQVRAANGTDFTVSIPENPSVVLPGCYWLFAMNSKGVPSRGFDVIREPPKRGPGERE